MVKETRAAGTTVSIQEADNRLAALIKATILLVKAKPNLTPEQLANAARDHSAFLTAHQDISHKANTDLNNVSSQAFLAKLTAAGVNTSLFGEFKGVLDAAPDVATSTDLDWYIDTAEFRIHVFHNGKWNATTAAQTMTKQALLTMLNITQAQLDKLNLDFTLFAKKTDLTINDAKIAEAEAALNA